MTSPTGNRWAAADRRQSLIDAAARTLAQHGAGGVSVRLIAAEASASPSLVTHHFEGLEQLIAATYRAISDRVIEILGSAPPDSGSDPRTRLNAYVSGNFLPPVMDAGLLATWLALLSLTKSMPLVAAAHAETYARFRAVIEDLVTACGAPGDARLIAVGLAALIDGLWLELCLDQHVFTPAEATALALRWTDQLLGQEGVQAQ